MASAAIDLHRVHRQIDPETKRHYSIGLIRTANIDPCVSIAMHLMDRELPDGVEVRLITYHSRHVLLMRSEIESYLGRLLYRRDDRVLADDHVRRHLNQSNANDVIFIVIASPVCEVGRDHDYDWTVAEPSSFRSLIQIVGRVRRHRGASELTEPNVHVANLNYLAFVRGEEATFIRPGFEDTGFTPAHKRRLRTKRIDELIDIEQLAACIDSRPRIVPARSLDPEGRLADLEHAVLADILNSSSRAAHSPHGWNTGCHYLIDAAQQATRFRSSLKDCKLYLDAEPEDDEMPFRVVEPGNAIGGAVKLSAFELADESLSRMWLLPMDYAKAIDQQAERFSVSKLTACKRFGELVVPETMLENRTLIWSPQCGAFRESG
jgi:CRISPR-associated endonuclease/helicase Cas3